MLPIILGLLALGGLVIVTTRKKAPPTPKIPPVVVVPYDVEELVQEIKQAPSLPELNTYYTLIGERFINMEYSYVEYKVLYEAYRERWYELIGGSE